MSNKSQESLKGADSELNNTAEIPGNGESTPTPSETGTEESQPTIKGDNASENESTDATGHTNLTESTGVTGSTGLTDSDETGSSDSTDSAETESIGLADTVETWSTAAASTDTIETEDNDLTTTVETGSTRAGTEPEWTFDESEFSDGSETQEVEGGENEDEFDIEWNNLRFFLSPEILSLQGRHIRAEDPKWALVPVPELSETIVRAAQFVKGPGLDRLVKLANYDQFRAIIKILPLDIPLEYTLPINDFDAYWERKCDAEWANCPRTGPYKDWKTQFVERTVQDCVENFVPGISDMQNFKDTLSTYKNYLTRLEIYKLFKRHIDPLKISVTDEDFDSDLDDFLNKPDSISVFVDFELVLGTLSELTEFVFFPTPSSWDNKAYKFSTRDFNSFFRGLKHLTKLEKLRCSNWFLAHKQMQTFLQLHFLHPNLRRLELSYGSIDDALCDYIGKLLVSSCPLEVLVLKYNQITDEGAEILAAALSANEKLKRLDLSMNWIQDGGGIALAKVLSMNSTLEDLDVSRNKITADAGAEFAEALCTSESIKSFRITGNNLGEDVGRLFLRSVVENQRLIDLEVKDCLFSPIDTAAINKAILMNRKQPHNHFLRFS